MFKQQIPFTFTYFIDFFSAPVSCIPLSLNQSKQEHPFILNRNVQLQDEKTDEIHSLLSQ